MRGVFIIFRVFLDFLNLQCVLCLLALIFSLVHDTVWVFWLLTFVPHFNKLLCLGPNF